jgi:hypothetical protein
MQALVLFSNSRRTLHAIKPMRPVISPPALAQLAQ